jgi:hypothetical protein
VYNKNWYVFIIFFGFYNLRTGNRLLDEVVLHVTLEVEVSELIRAGESEELGKAGIRVNLAPIGLVLKTLLTNVGVNLLAHLSASHLGSNRLSEELGELITDAGGLDKPGRLPVSSSLPLLRVLLGALELARKGLLEGLVIALHGSEETGHLLELGTELLHLEGSDRGLGNHLRRNGGGLDGNRRDGDGGRGRLSLLSTNLLLGDNNVLDDGGGSSSGSGLLIGLGRSNHFRLYTTIPLLFK